MEASTGSDFLVNIPGLGKHRKPSAHLLFKTHDCSVALTWPGLWQPAAQNSLGWLSCALDNRQMVSV